MNEEVDEEVDEAMDAELIDELGALAVELARGAAALIRNHARDRQQRLEGHSVSAKSTRTDLVTDVDRASEQWLVGRIAAARPGDAVLAEEGSSRTGTTGVRWVLDPIDGTVNFVLGLPEFAVSVAAELEGRVVAGAVCAPVSGELFRATLGGGAFVETAGQVPRRLAGPRQVPLDRAVVGTGFGYDRVRRARQGEVVARLVAEVADVRRIGSAALDLCCVAAGRLDAYYEVGLNPWDRAAGGLIAQEAGCTYVIDAALTAAAGPGLAAELLELLTALRAGEV